MDKLQQAFHWLKDQAAREKFAEISVKLIIHDGQIKRVEKTITEKEQ